MLTLANLLSVEHQNTVKTAACLHNPCHRLRFHNPIPDKTTASALPSHNPIIRPHNARHIVTRKGSILRHQNPHSWTIDSGLQLSWLSSKPPKDSSQASKKKKRAKSTSASTAGRRVLFLVLLLLLLLVSRALGSTVTSETRSQPPVPIYYLLCSAGSAAPLSSSALLSAHTPAREPPADNLRWAAGSR